MDENFNLPLDKDLHDTKILAFFWTLAVSTFSGQWYMTSVTQYFEEKAKRKLEWDQQKDG